MVIALMLAAALAGSPPGDPDEVIATAPVGVQLPPADSSAPAGVAVAPHEDHGLTTDQQIERWLSSRAAPEGAQGQGEAVLGPDFGPERRIHGEVAGEIGTNGHRAFGGWVTVPIGETGFVSMSYTQSRGRAYNRHRYGPDEWPGPYGAVSGPDDAPPDRDW